jgi:TRAP-type C4-dicarboxylate transport system substrate-binding protein
MYRQRINIEGQGKLLIILALVVLLASGFFGASREAPAAERIVLKMASPMVGPPALTTAPVAHFMDLVAERTKGRVQFKTFWAGSLFSPGETVEAVGDGRTDFLHYPAPYGIGKLPLACISLAVPFKTADLEMLWKVREQLHKEFPEFEQEFTRTGGKLLTHWGAMVFDIQTKTPVRTLDDMKGKKIAVMGGYWPVWVGASGAVPIALPAPERYVAFERGVLDGQTLMMDQFTDYKFYEVLKHYTDAGLGCGGSGHMLVAHLKSWEKLPPDIQQVMLDVAREVGFASNQRLEKAKKELIQLCGHNGVTFYAMPEKDRLRWATLMPDTPAKWATDMEAKGLPGWKMMERYLQLMEGYGHKWPRKWGQR